MSEPIYITGMARTPMGGLQGDLAALAAYELGAAAIAAAVERAGLEPEQVPEVIMGNVLPAGQGQAPARQAAISAGHPVSTAATTINKMCGSGMQAMMLAHDRIRAGTCAVHVAGGMESMTNAPYLLPKARSGLRLGHGQVVDHMFLDGLEDAYDKGRLMGTFAEATAEKYNFSREAQDEFAIESLKRARKANEDGTFDAEMIPVAVNTRKGEQTVDKDEQPFNASIEKIPQLKPAFAKDGTVTAANASSISDGAAALVLMSESAVEQHGATPIARIVGHATFAQEPAWFTTAPVGATKRLLEQIGWDKDEVDLYEVNEAFACVAMAAMKELDLPHDKVNVHGGACALGHPIGASGARIVVTLLAALAKYDLKRGVAAICLGGGEATAVALERVA